MQNYTTVATVNSGVPTTWQDSLSIGANAALTEFYIFLPKLISALLVLFVGMFVGRIVRRVVVKALEAIRVSKMVEKTPLELFLKNAEFGQKIEEVIGGLVYWLFLFVVLYVAVSLLGLTSLSQVMDKVLGYIPHVFSAFLIFIFGVLLAGVVESVIKGSMRSINHYTARLFAKMASYAVVIVPRLRLV